MSVDGKEAWSVRSVDFEEALGRCDVRTNTVVPVSVLATGNTSTLLSQASRILSCDGLVHALFLQSLVPPLSLPLFLDSLINNGGFVLQRGERHFLRLSVCLSPSLSFTIDFYALSLSLSLSLFLSLSLSLSLSLLHHRVLWQEINQVRGYGFGAHFFFLIL